MSLPSGYTQLEYIQSSGTQYIDTGLSLPEGFHAVFDVEFTSLPATIQCVLGAHETSYPYYRNFFGTDGKGTGWEMGCYGFADFGSVAVNTRYEVDVCNISGSIFCTVNGVAQTVNPNDVTSSSRSSRNIYVLGMNYAEGLFPCYAKLRSMKLYADAGYNTLLRDYVPCISDAYGIGMFDMTESKFYANAGTGTFTAGPTLIGTHKVLINGTEYEVKGGKCSIDGVGYSIKKGRTLVNGTSFEVLFEKSEPESKPTWVLNRHVIVDDYFEFSVNFTSNGLKFDKIRLTKNSGASIVSYRKMMTDTYIDAFRGGFWPYGEEYRTIIFDEEPTNVVLLAWLQANAVQQ